MGDRGFAYGLGQGMALGCSLALAPVIIPAALLGALLLLVTAPLWLPLSLLYRWMEKTGKIEHQPGQHFFRQEGDGAPKAEWFHFTDE